MTSRHALIVGINQYPNAQSLRTPACDAEAMAQI
ncbi:MAG: caspase family protein [Methyloglobulus sp.]|nr:caspase family protein [Methyloglobulus sp.]